MIPPADQQRCQALVQEAAAGLLDPQGRELAAAVQWWPLPDWPGTWPVAVVGSGPPVLLLHGFDSSFLEFRRLAPLLAAHCQLFIPDLYGFGFTPRPAGGTFGPEPLLAHLEQLLAAIAHRCGNAGAGIGLIGASMGGAVAVELARRQPEPIRRLLLLAPAGLTGRPMPVPPLLDGLGVRFLALPGVGPRRGRRPRAGPPPPGGPPARARDTHPHQAPRWGEALAAFARSGGFAGCGSPLPAQPLQVLWGAQDRILRPPQKRAAQALLGERLHELDQCGHLPHIDQPDTVARHWLAEVPV